MWVGRTLAGDAGAGPVTAWRGLVRTARPKQWVKNVLVFAAPGAAGVLDDWPQLGQRRAGVRRLLLRRQRDVLLERHPRRRRRSPPPDEALPPDRRRRGRRSGTARVVGTVCIDRRPRRRRADRAVADRRRGRRVRRADDPLQRVAQARRRDRHRRRRLRVRAAGDRPGRWPSTSRCRAGSCCARCSARCSSSPASATPSCARWARRRRPCGPTLDEYSLGYLRIVLTVSIGAALVSYCQWAFETSETADADLPFYELSIVPMLTGAAALRARARAGSRRRAGGGLRQRPGAAAARAGVGRRLRAGRVRWR